VWELCRSLYQTTRPPILIGGGLRLAGFVWAMLTQRETQIPAELVRFTRNEQMQRLRKFFALKAPSLGT
jgi:hypothetical protein